MRQIACLLATLALAGCGGDPDPVATLPAPAAEVPAATETKAADDAARGEAKAKARAEARAKARTKAKTKAEAETESTAPEAPTPRPAPRPAPTKPAGDAAAVVAACQKLLGPTPARPSDAEVAQYAADRAERAEALIAALPALQVSGNGLAARSVVLDTYGRLVTVYQQLAGAASTGNPNAVARLAPALYEGEAASADELRRKGLGACAPTK